MSAEENKAIARRWMEEGFNAHNVGVMDELFTADFVEHVPFAPPLGREEAKQGLMAAFTALPDTRITIDDMIAEGDKVVVRFTSRATHQGDLMGIPATGKPVTTTTITILRFAQGQIAEDWVETDMLGMMRQLGAIPTPGHTGG
jgi:steroid delta-isomerase-like uncharacterized protein